MTEDDALPPLTPLGVGPEYDGVHLWLPQLFAEHMRRGERVIEGKTFRNCRFEGPAVVLAISGCSFDGCNMGESGGNPRNLLLSPVGEEKVVGVIAFRDCRFERCAFHLVGFTGPPTFLKQFDRALGGRSA